MRYTVQFHGFWLAQILPGCARRPSTASISPISQIQCRAADFTPSSFLVQAYRAACGMRAALAVVAGGGPKPAASCQRGRVRTFGASGPVAGGDAVVSPVGSGGRGAAARTPSVSTDAPAAPPAAAPAPAVAVAGARNSELLARRKVRVTAEIIEAAHKARLAAAPDQIRSGLDTLEALVPGFTPNLDTLKASEWARLAVDAPAVASKIILLKTHYPRLDLARVLVAHPKLLLKSLEQLERSALQVRSLLSRAVDMERLLASEPALMDPRSLISVLITVTKWYHLEKDPVEVLEADPDLVRRAQDDDVPFEPVYMDEQGNWTAPLLNYKEKRTEWQKYIDQTSYRQP